MKSRDSLKLVNLMVEVDYTNVRGLIFGVRLHLAKKCHPPKSTYPFDSTFCSSQYLRNIFLRSSPDLLYPKICLQARGQTRAQFADIPFFFIQLYYFPTDIRFPLDLYMNECSLLFVQRECILHRDITH